MAVGGRIRAYTRPVVAGARVVVEFTVEPFVEGRPGPHVLAALAAVRALGVDPVMGPFATSVRVEADEAAAVAEAVVRAALGAGATRVSVSVEADRG